MPMPLGSYKLTDDQVLNIIKNVKETHTPRPAELDQTGGVDNCVCGGHGLLGYPPPFPCILLVLSEELEKRIEGGIVKAILITAENIDALAAKFAILEEDRAEMLPLGYILVPGFDDQDYDLLTQENFDSLFEKVEDIKNGFMAIRKK